MFALKRLLPLIVLCVSAVSGYCAVPVTTRAVLTRFAQVDEDTISFVAGSSAGMLIPAGQSLEFVIPAHCHGKVPNFACIKHRKDRAFLELVSDGLDLDSPWLSTSFHNPETDEWVTWQDQFGPEKRSAATSYAKPKQNTLYNFPEYVGLFSPDRVRVSNRGSGDLARATASFHSLDLTYLTGADRCPESARLVLKDFVKLNSLSLRYELDQQQGLEIGPGKGVEFVFPDEFKNRNIFHVILKHRKDPRYAADAADFDAHDPDAAYILCEARSSLNKLWYRWADRSSFAKFSEVRTADNPENETLHNGLRTFGQIKPDRFRITNVAKGDPQKAIANVHELEFVFMPEERPGVIIEQILTPETAFSDASSGKPVPLIGGGPRLQGKFPGAVVLGKNREARLQALLQLPEAHRFAVSNCASGTSLTADGNLQIPLPAGYRLAMIELAAGDLDITSLEYNKDGYFGRSGQAQISVFVESEDGRRACLVDNSNVGMAGMVTCGGPANDELTRPGDRLLLQVSNDEIFLMGYRITLHSLTPTAIQD